jgi:hypothetical protein
MAPDPIRQRLLEVLLEPGSPSARSWLESFEVPLRPDVSRELSRLPLPAASQKLTPAHLRRRIFLLTAQHAQRQNVDKLLECGHRLAFELSQRTIPCMILKGGALNLFYPEVFPGFRSMGDVDLLVPSDCSERAIAAALDLGFLLPARCKGRWRIVFNEAHLWTDDGCMLDLHWRLRRAGFRDAELWAAAEWKDWDGVPIACLNPADLLLHLCAHALPGYDRPDVRWIVDCLTILRSRSVDWDRFVHQAGRQHLALALLETLPLLRRYSELPAGLEQRLAAIEVGWLERACHVLDRDEFSHPHAAPATVLKNAFVRYATMSEHIGFYEFMSTSLGAESMVDMLLRLSRRAWGRTRKWLGGGLSSVAS